MHDGASGNHLIASTWSTARPGRDLVMRCNCPTAARRVSSPLNKPNPGADKSRQGDGIAYFGASRKRKTRWHDQWLDQKTPTRVDPPATDHGKRRNLAGYRRRTSDQDAMSMRNASRSVRPNRFERGIALILVLWVVALLAVIAGSFVYGARSTALVAGNLVSFAKARALADAGVHRGLYELARPATDAERWKADSRTHVFSLDAAEIRLVMRDESAKIDLNTASDALLKGLLLSAGLDEEQANQLLDAILDWRDVDELTRPQGAERDRYEAMGLPYIPTNAPFQTVDELQRVIGVTPGLYRKLAGALTVFSRSPGINSTLAPRQVLLALPNVTEADVDAYLAQREEMLAAEQVPCLSRRPPGSNPVLQAKCIIFGRLRKRRTVRSSSGRRRKVGTRPKQPFIFLLWQERAALIRSDLDQWRA